VREKSGERLPTHAQINIQEDTINKKHIINHLCVQTKQPLVVSQDDDDGDCFVLVHVQPDYKYATIKGWIWAQEAKNEKNLDPQHHHYLVGERQLHPPPLPVWENSVVHPRTTPDPNIKNRKKLDCVQRLPDDEHSYVCPRCGWAAKHLIPSYYDSQWNIFGGLCAQCCVEVSEHFDKTGWPKQIEPPQPNIKLAIERAKILAERTFGLRKPRKRSRRKKNEPNPDQDSFFDQ